jgi:hypothetical protein
MKCRVQKGANFSKNIFLKFQNLFFEVQWIATFKYATDVRYPRAEGFLVNLDFYCGPSGYQVRENFRSPAGSRLWFSKNISEPCSHESNLPGSPGMVSAEGFGLAA